MPSAQELSNAILQSAEYGAYPEEEEVASAELPADAIPTVLSLLENAREDVRVGLSKSYNVESANNQVKKEIRDLSHDTAPDIDGWIAQAKQLQADIERSKEAAREIVREAEAGAVLRDRVNDAYSKVDLLSREVSFNATLAGTLEQVKHISTRLDAARGSAEKEDLVATVDILHEVDDNIRGLGPFENTRVAGLLRSRAVDLRGEVSREATDCWHALVQVNSWDGTVKILGSTERGQQVQLETVVTAVEKLEILDEHVTRFSSDLDRVILTPLLRQGTGIEIQENSIRLAQASDKSTVVDILNTVTAVIEILERRLPKAATELLSNLMMPGVIERLTSNWLIGSVPTLVGEMQSFQDILTLVSNSAEKIDSLNWAGGDELMRWVDEVPRIWLAKRREAALSDVRRLLSCNIQKRRTFERIETQTLAKNDVIMTDSNRANDDWDEAWEDKPQPSGTSTGAVDQEDGEDTSAWDIDGEDPLNDRGAPAAPSAVIGNNKGTEDEEDAWGWNEDERDTQVAPPLPPRTMQEPPKHDNPPPQPSSTERSLTLRETYTATEVPDGILEIINQLLSDASTITQTPLSQSPIAPASGGFYAIPALILAMFRAISSHHYTPLIGGAMLLYNDTLRLCDLLSTLLFDSQPSARLNLAPDLSALQAFARRVYGREMESQRTILRDLLDGAQGFANCTVAPFAGECENAIAMTVDRMREIHRQWEGILSRSALLQSLGSLLATIINKMIVDIEDMSDISEEESKRLRHFCIEISKLSELFAQERPSGADSAGGAATAGGQQGETDAEPGQIQKADVTGIYTPNWLKFQYLSEILEASLADIKFLWLDGELRLEFEAEELVDLVRALFAESEYRRSAIWEIRRAVGRRGRKIGH